MNLWPVEHFFNIFIIKIRFSLSNVLIRGESNFNDKFSTSQKFIFPKWLVTCKMHTLVFRPFFKSSLIYIDKIYSLDNSNLFLFLGHEEQGRSHWISLGV
jgi:hypothetical protein